MYSSKLRIASSSTFCVSDILCVCCHMNSCSCSSCSSISEKSPPLVVDNFRKASVLRDLDTSSLLGDSSRNNLQGEREIGGEY